MRSRSTDASCNSDERQGVSTGPVKTPCERTNELQSHELFHNIDVVLVQIERIGQFSLIVSTKS